MENEERAIIKKYVFWFVLLLFSTHIFYTKVVVLNREQYAFEERKKIESLKVLDAIKGERVRLTEWKGRVKDIAAGEAGFTSSLLPRDQHWQLVDEIARAGKHAKIDVQHINCGRFAKDRSSARYSRLPVRITANGDYGAMKRFLGWIAATKTVTCDSVALHYDLKNQNISATISITGWFR